MSRLTAQPVLALALALAAAALPAQADELSCDARALLLRGEEDEGSGSPILTLRAYPASVALRVEVSNELAFGSSTVLHIRERNLGFPRSAARDGAEITGGFATSALAAALQFPTRDSCLALAKRDGGDRACDPADEACRRDADTAVEAVVEVAFEGGVAQCRTSIVCAPAASQGSLP